MVFKPKTQGISRPNNGFGSCAAPPPKAIKPIPSNVRNVFMF